MNKLNILTFPDPRVRKTAEPVIDFNDELNSMASDMLHTMYEDKGIGLAATQVDIHKRLIVIDLSEDKSSPLYIVNPDYEILDDTFELSEEGCLSIPSFRQEVKRAKKIKLKYQDLNGLDKELTAEGLLGFFIQH